MQLLYRRPINFILATLFIFLAQITFNTHETPRLTEKDLNNDNYSKVQKKQTALRFTDAPPKSSIQP